MHTVDPNLSRIFKQAKNEIVKKFGLPSWMQAQCGTCRTDMTVCDILEFGVCLTPQFLGDITCSFMCPKCNALWEKHFQLNVTNLEKLAEVLADSNIVCQGADRHTLIQQGAHNVANGRTGVGMIKTGTITEQVETLATE